MIERVLYLVICAAGPAGWIDVMVSLARAAGWSVYCLATPAAVEHFLDVPALTGHPVRTRLRRAGVHVLFGPGEFEPHPPRTGGTVLNSYLWQRALAAASFLDGRRT